MNRRDFMGSVVAGMAASQIGNAASSDFPGTTERLKGASWIRNGLVTAGGLHEPYIFVLRRGGESLAARKIHDWNQSETLIRQLKDQGVDVFHTHFYKGFGMAAEMPEMLETKRAAEIAHRYGMKVDTYLQWNTMMYETFFAEEPRAKDWIQRDVSGLPILLTYGYQQSFRYRPCFSNQEYLAYLKKLVRFAVEEVKTDFIHFDNFDLSPEPDSCHSPSCVNGFRKYLKAKYSPEKLRERFGFENVEHVNPPQWNRGNPPEKMAIIFDPAIQEWIDFRCQVMADALRQMSVYAKSLNPEVAIEINPHGITGGNRAWMNAIDHCRLLTSTDAYVTEEENFAEYFPEDGRLVSKIRSYKLARTYDNVLMTQSPDDVATAEKLAFNQTIGTAGSGEYPGGQLPDYMLRYIAFYRKHRDLFVGTHDVATVGVLRSYPSITYHNARAQLSAILVEQALIQSRVPFHLILDEPLPDISKLKVLILPDSECLSDSQIAKIRSFVEGGGGLIAAGMAGLYDEWRRLRVEPGLKGLVDGQQPAGAYEEEVGALQISSGLPLRKSVGKGRVVYFPGIPYDGPLPKMEEYFTIDNRFWKRPANWEELIGEIRWAANSEMPVDISGPEFLAANLVGQPEKRREMLHLVNYNAKNIPSITGIDLVCRLPEGETAKSVRLYGLEYDAAVDLPFKIQRDAASFTVPEMKTYALVVIGW
ncbi:MAG TPA: alpha-amylase family protein [Terriglobia bacterium]|nr:alpha-amylase family protein [Terriglobia bacterium]